VIDGSPGVDHEEQDGTAPDLTAPAAAPMAAATQPAPAATLDFTQPALEVSEDFVEALESTSTETPFSLTDGRLNALDVEAPVALYCGANGTLDVYDIGANGQGRLAFSVALDDLRGGQMGIGLGNRLLLDGEQAELFALDLLSAYRFRFDPGVCG
jgi:hypothetical protein